MALFTENKILTKAVRYEFPNKTWTLSGLNYHIRKKNRCYRLSEEEARQRDKKYNTVSTSENIDSVQELVLSQKKSAGYTSISA